MKVSYYPGCTLRNKAKDLDRWARLCASALGFDLCEIEDWQCCGGVYTDNTQEKATKLSSVRALKAARDAGRPLITVCSACHNVIKRTNAMMRNPAEADPINAYMAQDCDFSGDYHGETEVYHYLEFLRDRIGFDTVRARVTHPLTGRRIAAYYGCLLLRPSGVMQMDDPENPTILESFIEALGAEPVVWPQRNECCGAYLALEDAKATQKRSAVVAASALHHGAEQLVTACPLCRYNLIRSGSTLPVLYFTELLAEALGIKEATND